MKHFIAFFFLLLSFFGFAQVLKPVKWTNKTEKISATEFILIFEGKIDTDWHVYSQFTPEDGPLPLELNFKNQKGNYELIGKTSESKTERKFNDVFGVDEVYFSKSLTLKQKIKMLNPSISKIDVNVSYQICKEACINDNKNFVFKIPAEKIAETTLVSPTSQPEIKAPVAVQEISKKAEIKKVSVAASLPKKTESLWGIFLATIIAGLLATITPCVFPMIPMTVSFFLKQAGTKAKGKFNAFFYGFCIIVIYVLISVPFHIFQSLSPDIFAEISTNVYLNIFFFIVFIVFAISFFGAFEITMPTSLANKADNASNSGGLLGIFFMALTLIIVSFSCTGPALGFVLGSVLSTDGGATILSIAMLGFGMGLALPFIAFALFPNLMKNLPKSGGWLNTVKVIFGFIELALAFKFLSNADLVLQTHLLEREVFLAIWIAIFAVMSLYLFGKIGLPHDSPLAFISVGRMLLGVVTLAFTIYLIPGLWGAPLKLISAFPPPQNYSESPQGFGGNSTVAATTTLPAGAVFGPLNIVSFEDYNEGIAYAKEVNKPVLVDFTGRACQNCRLMESNVWSDEQVLKILKNDIVLISLFCDEQIKLPIDHQYTSTETNSDITTVGQKWSEFQRQKFQTNARPYYVLMDANEKVLNAPVGYTPNIGEYLKWLKEGIAKYKLSK